MTAIRTSPPPAPSRRGGTGTTFHTAGGAVEVPTGPLSFAEFRAWTLSDDFPETGRISFLNGRVEADMSPQSINHHVKAKAAITAVLDRRAEADDLGEVFGDGVRVAVEAVGLSVEPDMTFVSRAALDAGRVRLTPKADRVDEFVELVGPPDLVVELVSDASVRKDTRDLFDLYFAAGVAEYWLIDARGEAVDFRLLTRGEVGWIDAAPDADGFRLSPVLGRRYRLDRTPRPHGLWRYDLAERDPA